MRPNPDLINLVANLLSAVKAKFFSETPDLLDVLYNDYIHSPTSPRPRKAKSGRRYYPDKNETDKIRVLYGNISRALSRGGEGNIFNVTAGKDGLILESGIDVNVKVDAGGKSVPLIYALYNEKTRPFQAPAFRDYVEQEYPRQIQLILESLESQYGS